jgi:hypothetical protein
MMLAWDVVAKGHPNNSNEVKVMQEHRNTAYADRTPRDTTALTSAFNGVVVRRRR